MTKTKTDPGEGSYNLSDSDAHPLPVVAEAAQQATPTHQQPEPHISPEQSMTTTAPVSPRGGDLGAESVSHFMRNMASAIMEATAKSDLVDQLLARVGALEAQIAGNTTQIAGNTTQIAGNVSHIAGNATQIAGNATQIAANASQIASGLMMGQLSKAESQEQVALVDSDVAEAQAKLAAAEAKGDLAAVTEAKAAVAAAESQAAVVHAASDVAEAHSELAAAEAKGDLAAVTEAKAAVAAAEAQAAAATAGTKQQQQQSGSLDVAAPKSPGTGGGVALQELQASVDAEFTGLRQELDELKRQTDGDVYEQVLAKTQENVWLTQRMAKMETRHHEAARQAASERAANAKRIKALEDIIREMVQSRGRIKKARRLGLQPVQEQVAADEPKTVRKNSLVTEESLALHKKDMKDYHNRTAAAIKIQRTYRRQLQKRSWPLIDYRAWAPEEETDPDVIEIEVEDATMVEGDASKEIILRKLNTHTNSIVALQSHMNEFSRIMKRDREENRKLHDEMLDYIENGATLAEDMKEAQIKLAKLADAHSTVQTEILLLQKDCQSIRTTAQEHYDDTEIHRTGPQNNGNVSGPRIELIEHKLNSHQQLLDVLGNSVDGSAVQDSVQLANKRHQEVSDKLSHIQKVMQQINDTAEDAQEKSKSVARRIDEMKSKSTGNLETNIKALGTRVSDLFSGHQTLSGSVQHLQRHVHTLLDKPKDNEEKEKLEAKISLMWRAKADRDEVDRAITRAVNTVLKRIPEEEDQSSADGPLLATWSCLGCGKRQKEMGGLQSEDEHFSGMTGGHKIHRGAEMTFGNLRTERGDRSDRVPPLALNSPTMPPLSKAQTVRGGKRQLASGGPGGPAGFNPRSGPSPKSKKIADGFATTQPLPDQFTTTQPLASGGMRGSKKLNGQAGFAVPSSPPTAAVSSVHYD